MGTGEGITTMIEVAKIVIRREREYGNGLLGSNPFNDLNYFYRDVEWISVSMDANGVRLTLAEGSPPKLRSTTITSPAMLVELAQVLMKAAESQAAYGEAHKALSEQMAKLDETFKDRISGLGLKEPDKAAMLRVVSNDDGVIEA